MSAEDDAIEIVLFEVSGTRYGADMTQVRRIGRADETRSVGAPLGPPTSGRRALIFGAAGAEHALRVDEIHGVRSVPRAELRRLPPAAGPSPLVLGAWLDRDVAVLLVDLLATTHARSEIPHA